MSARAALDAIGELDERELDLADAALQLARVDEPEADWLAVRAHLSELARDAAALAADIAPDDLSAQAGALAGLLMGRHGYAGDRDTYDDLANANLIRVVERRQGLPVALGILWLHSAKAAGWGAHGIDFPGHFLVGLSAGGTQTVLDVFAGGDPVDVRDLRTMLKRAMGAKAEMRPGMLAAMTNRAVLLRLQNNIKSRRLAGGDIDGALVCVEDMLRVAPAEPAIWQEAALMNERLGRFGAALRCFGRLLAITPDGDSSARVRSAMDELRTRLN